jgi:hypothetical protein
VTRGQREVVADWLILAGAVALFASLFLTWSHQFSAAFLAEWGSSEQLQGVPHDPTAWQVYSAADVLLAALALGLVAVALAGSRWVRAWAVVAVLIAGVFVVHALGHAPTNGANIFNPALSVPNYAPNSPSSGPGEVVALAGLVAAVLGLGVSFTAD